MDANINNEMTGPQLVDAFNKLVDVANEKGLEYRPVNKFSSREFGIKRIESIKAAILAAGKHSGHEASIKENDPKPKAKKAKAEPKAKKAKKEKHTGPIKTLDDARSAFAVRDESKRKALLDIMYRHLDKPVATIKLVQAVYGSDADLSRRGALMRVMCGLEVSIATDKLPFKIEKTKDEKGTSFGLYSN